MVAPSILHEEFCHVVKKYVRGRSVTPELALALTRGMLQSRIQILDDSVLHISALSLALEHPELSAYDAHFVAVAQQTGALLWTADKQLARLSEMIGVPTTLWSPP